MDMTMIYLLVGMLIAGIASYFISMNWRRQLITLKDKVENSLITIRKLELEINLATKEKNELLLQKGHLEGEITALRYDHAQLVDLRKEYNLLNTDFVKMESSYKGLQEKLDTQKEELEKIGDHFKFEFKNLAQHILEEKTEKFTLMNEVKMKAILDPLKADIGAFKEKVQETYDKESKERFSLEKEVGRLIEMTQHVSQEAHNLTTALKGNNKMQGNWGEMILESLLENSGLTKGREYFIQEFLRDKAGFVIKDENGNGLQPDVMIFYPDQRKIIIDSKVSLIAWDECIGCDSKEQQVAFMKEHINSLRRHIDSLSRKNYPKYALALDYVLLFIPIEPAFLEAVKTDVNLWRYAYEKKILLVSPTNLFAVLKIISDLWKVEQQNANAIAIANKAGALYDKFVLFLESFQGVGNKLQDAGELYTKALNQISLGRGNVIGKIEELKHMGANASKQIPDKLIEQSLLSED